MDESSIVRRRQIKKNKNKSSIKNSESNIKTKKVLPSHTAGWISFVSLSWLTPLMRKAHQVGIQHNDFWELHEEDCAHRTETQLEYLWSLEKEKAELNKIKPDLHKTIWKFVRKRIYIIFLTTILMNFSQFIVPTILMEKEIDFINEPESSMFKGYFLVLLVFGLKLIEGALAVFASIYSFHTATKLTGGIQSMLFNKVLKVRKIKDMPFTSILTSDMERIYNGCHAAKMALSMPVLFVLHGIYSVYVLGLWGLMGMFIYLCSYPLIHFLNKLRDSYKAAQLKLTDSRINFISEIFDNIKFIKMNAWEELLSEKVSNVRILEEKNLKSLLLFDVYLETLIPSISSLATVATLVIYTLTGNNLSPSEAFSVYSLLYSMEFTVAILPYFFRSFAETKMSISRIQKVLDLPEWEDFCQNKQGENSWFVELNEVSFSLNDSLGPNKTTSEYESVKLNNQNSNFMEDKQEVKINLKLEKGQLYGICGATGSGKSTLISGICGNLTTTSGSIKISGKASFVSQEPWIFDANIRENILVGRIFEKDHYLNIIEICALKQDIENLLDGDLTQLENKGANLSGGQRQRIHLARAMYGNEDVFLLDSPCSALDKNVSNHIFSSCIQIHLAKKSVMLVTTNISFLKQCDKIVYIENGQIRDIASHESLIESNIGYRRMLQQFEPANDVKSKNNENTSVSKSEEIVDPSIVLEKTVKEKAKQNRNYLWTFYEVCGGKKFALSVIGTTFLFTLFRISNTMWLRKWLDDGDGLENQRKLIQSHLGIKYEEEELKGYLKDNDYLPFYQLVFILTLLSMVLVGLVKGMAITHFTFKGATKLHDDMLNNLIRAPLAILNRTPTRKIINVFSSEMNTLDETYPFLFNLELEGFFTVSAKIIIVCFFYPSFIAPVGMFLIFLSRYQATFSAGVSQTKSLEISMKSPVLQFFNSAMDGRSIIRTLGIQNYFIREFNTLVDRHSMFYLIFRLSTEWFLYRIKFITSLITAILSMICLSSRDIWSAATVGFALTTITGTAPFIPFLLRHIAGFQAKYTSLEKIVNYAYHNDKESNSYPEKLLNWPSVGEIVLKSVKLRYHSNSPIALNNISVVIKGGEKIGIIGRTGAGKSSIFSALLRLVELESGSIEIDGGDISRIDLNQLRKSICVIPQERVQMSENVRFNIDPFSQFTDENVWKVLKMCNLEKVIEMLPQELESNNVGNLSLGEQQLLCLARALLNKKKIILLDEATSALDNKNNNLIQNTLLREFSNCTVLTIAHRLETIQSYDKILIIENGSVVAFDTPGKLKLELEDNNISELLAKR